jgi:hypothetical protein
LNRVPRVRAAVAAPVLLAAGVLAVYFTSLQNYVANGDTAEFQTVATILGINHPTGFPAFTLLGWAFVHALPMVDATARLGVMSSVLLAVALLCAYALAVLLGAEPAFAAVALAVVATGTTFWDCATRAEVHAMAAAASAVALLAACAWRRTGAPWLLSATLGALGLAIATHAVAIWTVAACAIVILAGLRRIAFRDALSAAACFLAGIALYAYLPIRSAIVVAQHLDPDENIGLPPGNAFWNYGDPSTLAGFLRLTSGSDFDKSAALMAPFDVNAWPAHAAHIVANAQSEYGWLLLLAALAGAIVVLVRDRVVAAALLVFGAAPAAFVLEYGAESSPGRYFLPCFLTLGVFAAVGASWALGRAPAGPKRLGVAVLLSVAVLALLAHRDRFGRIDNGPAMFRDAIDAGTNDRGILLVPWPWGTQLGYYENAERSLGHRIVVIGYVQEKLPYLGGWMRDRPVYVLKENPPPIPGVRTVTTTSGAETIVQLLPANR